ncbi:MAG TPA: hypothetical protein PLL69_02050 [Gemmatimonadales bacterium]|nr:hypothetical protein [Gemmatimonadales bacterium]
MRYPLLAVLLTVALLAPAAPAVAMQGAVDDIRPDLRIDGTGQGLSRIIAVAVAPDGRVIVGQPDDQRFLVYSEQGMLTGSFGRSGEGPGEFRTITIRRGWRGNDFWQHDLGTQRVTLFRPDGKLVATLPIAVADAASAGTDGSGVRLLLPSIVAVPARSPMLVQSQYFQVGEPDGWAAGLREERGSVLVSVAPDGTIQKLIAAWPELFAGCHQTVNGRNRPVPHCQTWHWAISPRGNNIAYVDATEQRGVAAVRVMSIRPAGDTAFVASVPVRLVPITGNDADSIRSSRIAATANAALRQDWRDIRLPAHFPSALWVVAADDGSVWVQLRTARDSIVWQEITPAGKVGRAVRLPLGVRLDVVTERHLYGIETDADGIQSVVRFPRS